MELISPAAKLPEDSPTVGLSGISYVQTPSFPHTYAYKDEHMHVFSSHVDVAIYTKIYICIYIYIYSSILLPISTLIFFTLKRIFFTSILMVLFRVRSESISHLFSVELGI